MQTNAVEVQALAVAAQTRTRQSTVPYAPASARSVSLVTTSVLAATALYFVAGLAGILLG